MNIRIATADDAQTLAGIINRAFVVEAFFKIGDRTSPEDVAGLMRAGGSFLIAEESGKALGCVFVKTKGDTGYFGMLSVDPGQQGRGLGRILIDASESHLRDRGCREVEIEIVNLREELPPFYEKFGYTRTEERPFPSPERASQPCHFIVMTKPLNQADRLRRPPPGTTDRR
jgi:ribosomal protein S18 acetylase RimI-like enzyme